jgi:hypothetical protein
MATSRLGLLQRLSIAVLTLILLSVPSGIELGHSCPIHDAIAGSSESTSHTGHEPQDGATAQESGSSKHCCTCIGSCVVATPALTTVPVDFSWLALESTAVTALVRADVRLHPLPRLLPFATAPPLS